MRMDNSAIKKADKKVVTKIVISIIVCVGLLFSTSSALADSDSTITRTRTICGYTFKITVKFDEKTRLSLDGARARKVVYSVKKAKKTTGIISNASITYGGNGPGFYYDKKKKKWKRAYAHDSKQKKIGKINGNKDGKINVPDNFKYVSLDSTTPHSVGATFWITYKKNGEKKYKETCIEVNQ